MDIFHELDSCVRCGACLSVCPVYLEEKTEPSSSRGKLALLKELLKEDTGIDTRLRGIISRCLLCGSCKERCPNQIRVDDVILKARSRFQRGLGPIKRERVALKGILRHPSRLRRILKWSRLIQGILFHRVPSDSGVRIRLQRSIFTGERHIPSLAKSFFLDEADKIEADKGSPRVALFAGCVFNYIYPHILWSTVNILYKTGAGVLVPRGQGCCGLPALGLGNVETAKSLILKNIDEFMSYEPDIILVPCASCAYMIKVKWPDIFAEEEEGHMVLEFCNRVKEYFEFFSSGNDIHRTASDKAITITYHDPCHLRRGLGIFSEPRKLLKDMEGINFIEMESSDRCCGSGGTFSLHHYGLSLGILNKKLYAFVDTQADALVTSCSGCLLHFADGFMHNGIDARIMHPAELWENDN